MLKSIKRIVINMTIKPQRMDLFLALKGKIEADLAHYNDENLMRMLPNHLGWSVAKRDMSRCSNG